MITEQFVKQAYPEEKIYFDPGFLNNVEDHLPYILRAGKYKTVTIDKAQALRFKGDFNGLLMEMGINQSMRYTCMRLAGFYSSLDYDGALLTIPIVDGAFFMSLAAAYATQMRR